VTKNVDMILEPQRGHLPPSYAVPPVVHAKKKHILQSSGPYVTVAGKTLLKSFADRV